MSDEATSGLGNEPAATDLDSILSDALKEYDSAPAESATAEGATAEQREPTDDASGRLQVQDGRVVSKSKDSAVPAASDQEPPQGAAQTAPAQQSDPVLQPIAPPARWSADDKAKFAAWPRDVQEAVIARHNAMEADYTRKTQDAAELRRTAEPYLNAIKPFEAYLNELAPIIGQTPDTMVASLLAVEYQLRTGDPLEKAKALRDIAASYGIDLAALNRGELPAAHSASQTHVNTPDDPHYQQLRQSFGTLEQRVALAEQMIEAERQRQTAQEIEAFASARDALGRPRHPHLPRVRGVMSQLLHDDPALTLGEAYQKAIEPLQQAIAEELRVRQETAERRRQEAVEKARKVAPVKSSGSAPNGSAKAKDLDALLRDNINAKIA
jgi:hypothetical protein